MNFDNFNISIPTWDNGQWTETEFTDKQSFISFVESVFKQPGTMELDETSMLFNEQARNYDNVGYYCASPKNTKDYVDYWDAEKKKCRNGVIYKNNGKTFYLPREYYMWINFLPIYDKIKKKFDFPQIWDVQIYMALYELLAELKGKHAVIVKKRQIASSYYHCAKLINQFWFEEGAVLKMGASLKEYWNRSWKYLDEYRNFLHSKTAWQRPLNPGRIGEWVQKAEIRKMNKIYTVGLKSMLSAVSFEKSDTASVGGPVSKFFYEEAGIAPSMDKTYVYLKSAMEMGDMTTGQFIAAGSVGELKDCEPLKEFILHPDVNGFYGIETNLIDENGSIGTRGLFIPEQWGMPPYIDNFGNSMVEDALKALNERFEKLKKEKDPASYQLEISQHPRNLNEAFAYRDASIYPIDLIETQKHAIEDGNYHYELVDLNESVNGEIIVTKSSHSPITQWPVRKELEDKSGAIQVWERPVKDPSFNEYIASIDPVKEGKTTTSDSLCSIYVYRMPVTVKRFTAGKEENYVEGDKIVCCWTGRFNTPNETHKRLELILKWYKCRALVEANVTDFINYMMHRSLAPMYLIRRNEMLFLKEYNLNTNSFQEYGWKNTNKLFKEIMTPMMINWLKEVVDEVYDDNGVCIKQIFGIRRIPDKMVLEEMAGYTEGKNVDRIVSLTALVCYVKIQMANHLVPSRIETDDNLENNKKLYKLEVSPFGKSKWSNKNYNVKKKLFTKLW